VRAVLIFHSVYRHACGAMNRISLGKELLLRPLARNPKEMWEMPQKTIRDYLRIKT
jgi:hypothetical protein